MPHESAGPPLSGRRAQAARNDTAILTAAREVFVADPDAPVAAVAQAAGVGISALYRRYPSKEELLATLCLEGLRGFVEVARSALEVDDPWTSFETFLRGVVAADVHSLSVHLAGRFTPTPEHAALADEAGVHAERILRRAQDAGVVRADVVDTDLPMVYEQLAAIRLGDPERVAALRRRYVELHLAGLRAASEPPGPLPERAPTHAELGARWVPRT
ncbi:TetR/AcrR family transcriptional regulator [Cellulosimicrobium arenosum]|uniref:TetR family transcriptional regulator n=1 Tax=Cellulosimicrobium arenosum TaxID=2708133 RepID=A0A927G888_9MICO|nr:TetR family transcriptional regulator [Cellulosimicrobium arenosum]MBD8078528.1 TetR family transcriptional regulator [Cellulosimicrobium arenosum]